MFEVLRGLGFPGYPSRLSETGRIEGHRDSRERQLVPVSAGLNDMAFWVGKAAAALACFLHAAALENLFVADLHTLGPA